MLTPKIIKDEKIRLAKMKELTDFLPKGGEMVEIGCFHGISTAEFSKYFKIVHAVDPWAGFYQYGDIEGQYFNEEMGEDEKIFDKRTNSLKNIIKHKIRSVEGSKLFPDNYFDFIYIDGCHTYEAVKEDINNWFPKIKNNCYFGGHDYNTKSWPRVIQAVDEFFERKPDKTFPDKSWVYLVTEKLKNNLLNKIIL